MDEADCYKFAYMSDVGDRIFQRLEILDRTATHTSDPKKYTAARLARHIKVSQSTISQWKHGSTKWPRPQHLCKAAQYLNTTEWWLAFGKGDPRCDSRGNLKDPGNPHTSHYPLSPENMQLIEAAHALTQGDRDLLRSFANACLNVVGMA